MKNFVKYLFFLGVFLIGMNTVKANSIKSIKMDIYLDKNGDAHITEIWEANLTEGTEGYRFYGNMGNSEIKDYSVKDESQNYEDTIYWDVNASFDDKAYKYGIHDTESVQELCFGISQYGSHTYTLSYTITGFVSQTEDADIVYWELIPSALAKLTNNVYIKIHADEKFSDDLDVWGYGNKGGLAYVYDGYIELSNDTLNSDDYMTVLIKFNKGTFSTQNILDNNFEHYYNMAEQGAEHYTEGNQSASNSEDAFAIILILTSFFLPLIIFFIQIHNNIKKYNNQRLYFMETGNSVPKDVPIFRDIPCNKDIYRAYWVACKYNLVKSKTDFLGVILLKWFAQDTIKIESKTVGTLFKKEETTIVFKYSTCKLDTELEEKLYGYMYRASRDGILESKEFEKWCKRNYNIILKWFDNVIEYETNKLIEEGKIIVTEQKKGLYKSKRHEVDSSMMEEAKQMKGLKNFFEEFENMTNKEAIEVKFWQEYLMYAQILGVAEKVAKQFKKLYPELFTDYSYNSILFVHSISYSGIQSAEKERRRVGSYSSGGGGFSSGGGGGGSFGSGGGGGFR